MRVKTLLLATTIAGVSLAWANTSAHAVDLDPEIDDCRSDIALKVSGQVNRAILYGDNGVVEDIFLVDNDNSSTRVRFRAVGRIDCEWKIGAQIEVQFESNSTAAIRFEQGSSAGPNNFTERKLEWWVDSETFGRVWLGQGDMASNGTSEVDLSKTSVVAFSSIEDFAGGLEFENGVRIRTASDNFDGQSRRDRVRYDTPTIAGFRLSTSYSDRDRWDVALRFANSFGDLKVAAAIGYSEDGANSEEDYRVSGSVSVLHTPTGLNATFAAAQADDVEGGRNGPVDRRDPYMLYGKLGLITDIFDFGHTAFAVDYQMVSDLDTSGDDFHSYGGFVVQKIDHVGTEFYAGVRMHELNAAGPVLVTAALPPFARAGSRHVRRPREVLRKGVIMTHASPHRRARSIGIVTVALGSLTLGGCMASGGYDSFQYHEIAEIPEGPGILSDDSGEYTILSREWGSNSSSSASSGSYSADQPRVTTSGGITEASTPE